VKGNRAGMRGIPGNTACREAGNSRGDEGAPGGFRIRPEEAGLYPGIRRLCAGAVTIWGFWKKMRG